MNAYECPLCKNRHKLSLRVAPPLKQCLEKLADRVKKLELQVHYLCKSEQDYW